MGEPDPRAAALEETRQHLKDKLGPYRTHLRRILDHIHHMEQGDLDQLGALLEKLDGRSPAERGEIIKRLRAVHPKEQCQIDLEREEVDEEEPPSGPLASLANWLRNATR